MDRIIQSKYNKEYSTSPTPNYEREFLKQMFGYNVSLYKANTQLNNWTRLAIQPLTGNLISNPCNH